MLCVYVCVCDSNCVLCVYVRVYVHVRARSVCVCVSLGVCGTITRCCVCMLKSLYTSHRLRDRIRHRLRSDACEKNIDVMW